MRNPYLSPTGWFAEFRDPQTKKVTRVPVAAWEDRMAMIVLPQEGRLRAANSVDGFEQLVDATHEQIAHCVPAEPGWVASYSVGDDGHYVSILAWAISAGGDAYPLVNNRTGSLKLLHPAVTKDLLVRPGDH